jgi:hypothetical protein
MITEEAYSIFKIKLDGKLTYEMKGTWSWEMISCLVLY